MSNGDFDELAGAGQESFSTDQIEEDMKKITEEKPFTEIKTFRDQYVAHNDLLKEIFTLIYSDLYKAFDVVEEIFKRYYLFITASSILDLTPTMQGNWKEVLTIPWVDKK
jgi:hypothetical protein